jgi:DNA invertase Pin-like site-specific DNA recombinase
VHRLVYEAFHGKLGPGLVVNHKDGDKSNARLENLEAMTHKENVLHAFRVLGRRPTGEKLTIDQAREIRELRAQGEGLLPIAKRFGVTRSTVWLIVHGKNWKHAGGPIEPVRPVKQTNSQVRARISDDDIERIRGRVAAGETKASIAREFRVANTTVGSWIAGKTRRPRTKMPRDPEEDERGQLSLELPV